MHVSCGSMLLKSPRLPGTNLFAFKKSDRRPPNQCGLNHEGLYGTPVPLEDGSTVMADERYIRESILLPNERIVAGYEPEMPSFAGAVTEDDLIRLIAYIKSLADEPRSQ